MPTLGILGGLGPMASVWFYELLTKHTMAQCDQDHLDIVLSSRATTPDRTAYILGASEESPLECMLTEAKKLEAYGADLLVMPCNTAHYFYDSIRISVGIPMLNIVDETLALCARQGMKRVGLLATDGTVEARTYQRRCGRFGLDIAVPSAEAQKGIMSLIYDDIKKGGEGNRALLAPAEGELAAGGCDGIILGCTELSLLNKQAPLGAQYIDSLEALAAASIAALGKKNVGFSFSF